MDYSPVRAVLPIARERLFAIPGVHAVGVGCKIVAGEFTDQPAIMVFVVAKKPLADLAAPHVIPSTIGGVATDVYESPVPRLHSLPDVDTYKQLKGGIQIWPGGLTKPMKINPGGSNTPGNIVPGTGLGGIGTLGCFLSTSDVVPSVYAVTCQHVVGIAASAKTTNLAFQVNGTGVTFSTNDGSPTVTPNTLIVIRIDVQHTPQNAFYKTGATDAPAALPGILAPLLNANRTDMTCTGTGGVLNVTSASVVTAPEVHVYGETVGDTRASAHATVAGSTITFSGTADEFGGAFLSLNVGGPHGTYGGFTQFAPGASPRDMAVAVKDILSQFVIPDVTVDDVVDAPVLTFHNVQSLECQVTKDYRVGQPSATFCTSRCSRCCDHRIGQVVYTNTELDAALIELDAGIVYRAEIVDIGVITGVHDVTQDAAGAKYWKRGRTTGLKKGQLISQNTVGIADEVDSHDPPQWSVMQRFYMNALKIFGDDFSEEGDSGAAVVTPAVAATDGTMTTTVVGILFGGAGNLHVATPIQPIIDAAGNFAGNTTVSLVTATKANVDLVVPSSPAAHGAIALRTVGHRDLTPTGSEAARFAEVQREVAATPGGQFYGALAMRHLDEAQTLINNNRRMATVWHRNGGPAIAEGMLRMLEIPGQRIPAEVNGTPLTDGLQQIASAMARYGSDALAADLAKYGPAILRLAGLTYPELLTALQTAPAT